MVPQKHSPEEEWLMSQAGAKRRMARRLVWIDEIRLRGFGCSECAWVFTPSGLPVGGSLNEWVRNLDVQLSEQFAAHDCAEHPRAKAAKAG